MSCPRNNLHINKSFSPETSCADFYSYCSLKDLPIKCETQNNVSRCRTIGILQSDNGKFYLLDLDSEARRSTLKVRLSFIYLKSTLPSTVIPFPVQVFGLLQWKNRPVIFVNVLQVLNVRMALRLRDAMDNIANSHTASVDVDNGNDITENS